MIAQAAVIARASGRVLANHLIAALGSRTRAVLAVVTLLAVAAALNVTVYSFLASNLGGVFDRSAGTSAALVSARQSLIQSTALTAAAISLIFLMFTPAESHLAVTARVAGADRRAIALGQFVPVLGAVIALVMFSNLGVTVFLAQTQQDPPAVAIGLTALGVSYSAVVLTVHQAAVAGARAAGIPVIAARLLGLCAAGSLLGALLAELLRAIMRHVSSMLTRNTDVLWHGEELPQTPGAAALTVAVAVVLLAVLLGSSLATSQSGRASAGRLFSVPVVAPPRALVNFAAREALMALRHPVTQLTLATSALFSVLLLVGALRGLLPASVALAGLAILMSAGVETARGRTRDHDWVARLAGYPAWRRVAAQFCGMLVPSVLLFAAGVGVAQAALRLSPADLGNAALMLLLLSAVAYLSGVVLPFSATVPSGMLLTALLAAGLDGVALWGRARVASVSAPLGPAFDVAASAAALLCAWLVVRAQTRAPAARAVLSIPASSDAPD